MRRPEVVRRHAVGGCARLAPWRVLVGVFAVFAVGIAGCAGAADPVPAPPAEGSIAPSTSPAAPMAKSVPVRVRIPAIGVESALMHLALRADGTMEVPPDGSQAGWYTGAPTPGELGPAIIAGHVDWGGNPGVFYRLRDLEPGDEIEVNRDDGSTAVFRVERVERFPKNNFPTRAVYGNIAHAGLRLITCGGSFDPRSRSYADNVIAFAELAGT